MWHPFLSVVHLRTFYNNFAELSLTCAVFRAASCGVVILAFTTLLNRLGFRLKL